MASKLRLLGAFSLLCHAEQLLLNFLPLLSLGQTRLLVLLRLLLLVDTSLFREGVVHGVLTFIQALDNILLIDPVFKTIRGYLVDAVLKLFYLRAHLPVLPHRLPHHHFAQLVRVDVAQCFELLLAG